MKKHYYLTVDTETTKDEKVADFAAVLTDKRGNIITQCSVLVSEIYTDKKRHPLYTNNTTLWGKASLKRRYARYETMLKSGTRMVGSVAAINRWLTRALAQYNPVLTAYNLPFDLEKCENTGIDLQMFSKSFCLWSAAYTKWGRSAQYKNFVLLTHAFNAPTKNGNMTYKTNAETMARFVLAAPDLADEPHTALEDILFYELPILNKLLKTEPTKKLLGELNKYNWQDTQVRNHFQAANCIWEPEK